MTEQYIHYTHDKPERYMKMHDKEILYVMYGLEIARVQDYNLSLTTQNVNI